MSLSSSSSPPPPPPPTRVSSTAPTTSRLSRMKDAIVSTKTAIASKIPRPSSSSSLTPAVRRQSSIDASSANPGLLIYQTRPSSCPPKTKKEMAKHQQLVKKQINRAKTKAKHESLEQQTKLELVRKREDTAAATLQEWNAKILPNWDKLKTSKQVEMGCWAALGLPCRSQVWALCSKAQLEACLDCYGALEGKVRALVLLAETQTDSNDENCSGTQVSEGDSKHSWDLAMVSMDVKRTFPTLAVLNEGGPLHIPVRNLCAMFALNNKMLGYVQGMSYLAATVNLNLEGPQALACLQTVLRIDVVRGFHAMDDTQMMIAFDTMRKLLRKFFPKLHSHFTEHNVLPEYFLNEWIMTIFTKTLPVDVSMKIWDILFVNDLHPRVIFKFALALLKLLTPRLMDLEFTDIMVTLKNPFPQELDQDATSKELFDIAKGISLTEKAFSQIVAGQ